MLLHGALLGGCETPRSDAQPYRGSDITRSAKFELDETQLSARSEGPTLTIIRLPIWRRAMQPLAGTAKVGLWTLDDQLVAESSIDFQLSDWRADLEVPLIFNADAAGGQDRGELSRYVVSYEINSGTATIMGRRSLYSITAQWQLRVVGSETVAVGSDTRFRAVLSDGHDQSPIEGATIQAYLGARLVASALSDDQGLAFLDVRGLPEEVGTQPLRFVAEGPEGAAEVETPVQLERRRKTLITTDKPIYKPGQTVHVRTLTLEQPSLLPTANTDITLEVADAKGNLLFRQTQQTDAFGVAAMTLPLATELNQGQWEIRARLGDWTAVKTIRVETYSLPKFTVETRFDAAYYHPGETAHLSFSSSYFFGKPVAGGLLRVSPTQVDVSRQELQAIEVALDEEGLARVDLPVPSFFSSPQVETGQAVLELLLELTDGTGHSELSSATIRVGVNDLIVSAAPIAAVVPGAVNTLLVTTTDTLGLPVEASGKILFGGNTIDFVTGPTGVARVDIDTPQAAGWLSYTVNVQDALGHRTSRAFSTVIPSGPSLSVRTDRAFAHVGETVIVGLVGREMPGGLEGARIHLDLFRDGRTVANRDVLLDRQGEAELELVLDDEMGGLLSLEAYSDELQGPRSQAAMFVERDRNLLVDLHAERASYRPGEDARIEVQVTNVDGAPVVAAVGVSIVDEAVFALQDVRPGVERLTFELAEQLMNAPGAGAWSAESLLSERDDANREAAAAVLLTQVDVPRGSVDVDNYGKAAQAARERSAVATARELTRVIQWLQELGVRQDVARTFAHQIMLLPDLYDPWGQPYAIENVPDAGWGEQVRLTSPGLDERLGSGDDLSFVLSEAQF